MRFYAGIGSRTTPNDILTYMTSVAGVLETKGYTLRSGGAKGADTAFSNGVRNPQNKIIFRPLNVIVTEKAMEIAKSIHPAWNNCSEYAKACHGRNVYQILGADLTAPVAFVVCWTPNAELIGGTRTAIILAKKNRIPVYNLADKNQKEAFERFLATTT